MAEPASADYKATWYQQNRERILAAQKTPEVRTRRAEAQRRYRERHPDTARASVRSSRAKKLAEYRAKERARYIRMSLRNVPAKCGTESKYRQGCRCDACRYAAKLHRHCRNNGYRPTREQIQGRIDFYGHRCWMCGEAFDCIDHVIALNRGGTNHPANLRPACTSCNAAKKDKPWLVLVKR